MKVTFMKTSWFMGTPFLWNTLHFSENKSAKIFRFGPILIRVEKLEDENTKTPEPCPTCAVKARW